MTVPVYPEAGWILDAADPRLDVLWPGAQDYSAYGSLTFPLYVAAQQCAAFAPALAADVPVPDHYVAGQVMQCRALVRAGIVGDGDRIGIDGADTVAVFPMDWTVKNLLRPKRGKPYFGGRRAEAS